MALTMLRLTRHILQRLRPYRWRFTGAPWCLSGSLVALVGSTGAGKTTFVSLIPRCYDPTGGRVLLDGIDVREFTLHALRQQMSLVLQPPPVFPMSVRANITYGRTGATSEQVQRAASLAQLDDFLAQLPLVLRTAIPPPVWRGFCRLTRRLYRVCNWRRTYEMDI